MAARIAWALSGAGTMRFGAGELHRGVEDAVLEVRARFDVALVVELADQVRHAVVAQTARVDALRDEGVTEGVHLDQRRRAGGIAEVVAVFTLRQRRTRFRLHGDESRLARRP